MMIAGIVISIVAALLAIFPKFFLSLKSPYKVLLKKMNIYDSKKLILAVRIWGTIFLVVGIILIILSFG